MSRRHHQRKRFRQPRGQAMVEYSVINLILVVLLLLTVSVPIFPGMAKTDPQKNMVELFLDAYRVYYESYYVSLSMPFP
jgi:hypothetical protein